MEIKFIHIHTSWIYKHIYQVGLWGHEDKGLMPTRLSLLSHNPFFFQCLAKCSSRYLQESHLAIIAMALFLTNLHNIRKVFPFTDSNFPWEIQPVQCLLVCAEESNLLYDVWEPCVAWIHGFSSICEQQNSMGKGS